jgi:hypothetical protein
MSKIRMIENLENIKVIYVIMNTSLLREKKIGE